VAGIASALLVASFSTLAPEKASDLQVARDAAPLPTPASYDPEQATASRIHYPYSVVPGGVHSQEELAAALRDPVVAAHYGTLKVAAVRTEPVRAPRQVYVSYRVGDNVYWTKRKVSLHPGELVLTDGSTEIRSRCGNAISETAQYPTSDEEPALTELDRAIVPVPVARNEAPGPFDLLAPVPPGIPLTSPPLADIGDPVSGSGVMFGGPLSSMRPPASLPPGGPAPGGSNTGDSTPTFFNSGTPGGDDPAGPPSTTGGQAPVAVPEPGVLLLMGSGVAATALRAWRRRRRNEPPQH
jgi:hypothetical protein